MIPEELRNVPQWLVSGSDKAPRSPRDGRLVDATDRSWYAPYTEAYRYASTHGLSVGFALTADDPFTVIDLDTYKVKTEEEKERHRKIYEAFDTYAELSSSEAGVHIWCLGTVPTGTRRDNVEVYPRDRYMICTGKVLKNRPILDCQPLLLQLYHEMQRNGFHEVELEERESFLSDRDVFEMAARAANADKFHLLARGEWEGEYPSQSEADFALMNILAYYTPNNEQVKRLFRYSALGKRQKAQRDDYLERMLRKIRAEEPARIDFSAMLVNGGSVKTQETGVSVGTGEEKKPAKVVASKSDFTYPPGLLGDIARYIHDSSVRPVPEVAVAGAIALGAGIAGRQFQISATGLNQYIILLAVSGRGKEGAVSGMRRVLAAVKKAGISNAETFFGPGRFASAPGLLRSLEERPGLVSLQGEFGKQLRDLTDQRANSTESGLCRLLIDIYTKSGKEQAIDTIAYSDKTKNTKKLFSPALTIFGDTTPEVFYEALSDSHIEDGLIPRFLTIEYFGKRVPTNKNADFAPPEQLINHLSTVVQAVLSMETDHRFETVAEASGKDLLEAFDKECDDRINNGSGAQVELWNRAHLKALRLAALLAACDRPHQCGSGLGITEEEARWAIALVRADVERMAARFESGDVGSGASKQMAEMFSLLKEYRVTKKLAKSYNIPEKMHKAGVVPRSYLLNRLYPRAAFSKSADTKVACARVIDEFINIGVLVPVSKIQVKEEFKSTANLYHIDDSQLP
jgi:hypothetical protein